MPRQPLPAPGQNLPKSEIRDLYRYDQEGARRLLAEAGTPNIEAELIRRLTDLATGLKMRANHACGNR